MQGNKNLIHGVLLDEDKILNETFYPLPSLHMANEKLFFLDMKKWCDENLSGIFSIDTNGKKISFESEKDMMYFMLKWGEYAS